MSISAVHRNKNLRLCKLHENNAVQDAAAQKCGPYHVLGS